jgi:Kef-type K+ transport system membrane component KefB
MIEAFFVELSIIIIATTALGLVLRKLKQPPLLAYLLSGIILGTSFLDVIAFTDVITIFSDLGIVFLLFLVGINLDPRVLKEIGKVSAITGIGQIIFTAILGFIVASALGFTVVESTYIAIALTFSSTIIVIKLFSDKNELNALHAKVAIGGLLIQDFVAIIMLIFLASISATGSLETQIMNFLLSLVMFAVIIYIVSKYVVERLFSSIAKSQELLFLGAISWCLLLASVGAYFGFSKEIGAFLAGVSIAALPYSHDVFAKLKYLRDFFIVLFFVALGANLVITSSSQMIIPAIIFSLFVIIGNPLIVIGLMVKQGYSARTSFMSGVSLAQISEFSLILVVLAGKMSEGNPWKISNEIISLITIITVITIAVSAYLITHSQRIYEKIGKYLKPLENKKCLEDSLHSTKEKQYRIIFIGFGRTGKSVLRNLDIDKEDLLLIDFDPRVVKNAVKNGFNCTYGDSADAETIEYIIKRKPKIIVSTVLDYETNKSIMKKLKSSKSETELIALAFDQKEAQKLRSEGADYILIPSILAGKKMGIIISDLMEKRSLELSWLKKEEEEFD